MGLIILAALTALQADGAAPVLPGWMAGCWEQQVGDDWTEECWTRPQGGIMLGSGRSLKENRLRDWEVMQIEHSESDDPAVARLTFYGAPKGQGRTPFLLVEHGQPGVTFMNAEHDYPQRIRYWRDGEELVAEVALKDGSKARRWRYRRSN